MKRKIFLLLLTVVLAAGGYCLYMETHFTSTAHIPADLTAEEVLAERPDLAVSAADKALRDAVQALPEVQDALAATRTAGGARELSPTAAEAALGDLLPAHEGAVSLTVSEGQRIYLDLTDQTTRRSWQFSAAGDTIFKDIAVYRNEKLTALYSNNDRVYKLVPKHVWFAWLDRDAE